MFVCMIRFSGSMNSNMLSKIFAGTKRVVMQTKFRQNKPKLHKFQLCAKIEEFFLMYCNVYGVGENYSNVLSKFLREPRQLPWQPNLGKKKPKWH